MGTRCRAGRRSRGLAWAGLGQRPATAADCCRLLPTAQAYAERLQRLAGDEPALLAAHSYVRYLGDLSGGQALGRLVRQAYGLVGSAGSRFFDFCPPEQVKAMAARFRSALDALPLGAAQQQAQVDEARWAFAQHERLFEELAASV
jgi:heme oxygenase